MDTGRYAQLFLSESRDQLSEINSALLELENSGSEEAIARLFRAVHSMKGMSAAMGYTSVSELSHELETLFDRLRGGHLAVSPAIIDTLFAGIDALEQAVALATGEESANLDIVDIVARIKAAAGDEIPQTFTSEFPVMAQGKKHQPDAPVQKGPT